MNTERIYEAFEAGFSDISRHAAEQINCPVYFNRNGNMAYDEILVCRYGKDPSKTGHIFFLNGNFAFSIVAGITYHSLEESISAINKLIEE